MEHIDLNTILNRNVVVEKIKNILDDIINSQDITQKRGIYIHGESGIGKSMFVKNLLTELQYDIIYYDGSDLRNKIAMENIADVNIAKYNVSTMLMGKRKPIVIIMDDIESMNSGDKGGINALAKLIRPKKTKKQKLEIKTTNPIICICDNHTDKKIKEIMAVCHTISLPTPTTEQILDIVRCVIRNANMTHAVNYDAIVSAVRSFRGDLRKANLYIQNNFTTTCQNRLCENFEIKDIVNKLYYHKYSFIDHNRLINETDRTIVGLIYHENLAFILNKLPQSDAIQLYLKILQNMCYADFLDRITFQKQIWQFNEISSLIKTVHTNHTLHEHVSNPHDYLSDHDITFTKVLTKYSTEYNNFNFFQHLSFKLGIEYNDIIHFFQSIRCSLDEHYEYFAQYNISPVDITRLYRYIDHKELYASTQ
tara:strand:+ start:200 stop:1468 length:1269 start_codon:yes stop_codon:yes gene_type:complete